MFVQKSDADYRGNFKTWPNIEALFPLIGSGRVDSGRFGLIRVGLGQFGSLRRKLAKVSGEILKVDRKSENMTMRIPKRKDVQLNKPAVKAAASVVCFSGIRF